MTRIVATVILLLVAVPAFAQSTEIGALAGFTPAASLDRQAPQLDGVSLDSGVTFAISATQFLSERWGIAGEWSQQFSGFNFDTGESDVRLYDLNIAHLHGYVVYRFGDAAAKLRPFAIGGAGVTFLSAHDLGSESKLSFGVGGGLAYFISQALALEGRFIYKPTMMNDRDAADFCDAFGYCQSTLQQFELMGGVRFRF